MAVRLWGFKSLRPHNYNTMNKSLIEKQQDGTIKLTITIPHSEVKKTREDIVSQMSQDTKLPGFRKGKAPKQMVEGRLSEEQVQENVLKKLIPPAYIAAVEEHRLKPIMNPRLHVEKVEADKDWVFVALTCELPEINLGPYKDEVKKVTAKSKIVIPGKEPQKTSMNDIVKVLLENTKISVPAILVEQETDRLLSQLLDDIKRLGLSLEQYLGSTKRTAEDLRAEYAMRAQDDLKLEFVLQKIAEAEKITVEQKEIEEAVSKAKDPGEKQHLEANRYLLAGILRQQKTLDFLMNL